MSAQKRKDTPLLAVAAKLSAGKNKSLLRQAERLQRWPIYSRSNREAIVGLERRQRSACLRSEECINLIPRNSLAVATPVAHL